MNLSNFIKDGHFIDKKGIFGDKENLLAFHRIDVDFDYEMDI